MTEVTAKNMLHLNYVKMPNLLHGALIRDNTVYHNFFHAIGI